MPTTKGLELTLYSNIFYLLDLLGIRNFIKQINMDYLYLLLKDADNYEYFMKELLRTELDLYLDCELFRNIQYIFRKYIKN